MKTCSVDGCDRPFRCKGFCNAHYLKWRKHGDPLADRRGEVVRKPRQSGLAGDSTSLMAQRFWSLVDVRSDDECWEWQAARNHRRGDYGVFTSRRGESTQVMWRAHRLAYELHYGPFDPTLLVCHSCDNPPCVNPSHLFLGTGSDNMRDMYAKERNRPPRDLCVNGHPYEIYARAGGGRRYCWLCRRISRNTREGRDRRPEHLARSDT